MFFHAFFTGLLSTSGSVSEKPLSSWESYTSKERGHTSTSPEEQPYTEEDETPQEGGTTGDQDTVSSTASQFHGDVQGAKCVVMQKTSNPGLVVFY